MKKERVDVHNSSYWVPILGSAIKILSVFYDADSSLTLHEISSRAHVGKTSAFRILYTLDQVGYVEKDPISGKYDLGLGVIGAARKTLAGRNLVQIARPLLKSLRDEFGETTNLATLLKDEIFYLEIFESSHSFRMTDTVGSRIPWNSTALGKCIAAFLPEERVRGILKQSSMKRLTPNTITSIREYMNLLADVRNREYSLDAEESELGATCIAAPVFRAESDIIGAISVSGPTPRVQAKQSRIVHSLKRVALEISHSLGSAKNMNHRGLRS